MKINEDVSRAEAVANIIAGTGTGSLMAAVKPVAYRVPVHLLAVVDSMAAKAKKSRNAMLNLLLAVGIDEVRENLDQDLIESLSVLELEALQGMDTTESISE